MILATPQRVKEMDKITIENKGIPGVVLMENAGRGTAEILMEEYIQRNEKVLVIVGKGNNGGDGCVIARYLFNNGYKVEIAVVGEEEDLKGHAGINYKVAKNFGVPIEILHNEPEKLLLMINKADVIIDALLGTGFHPPLQEHYRKIIEAVNNSGKKVFAVDVPSGLDAFTGKPGDIAIRAEATFTMGLGKVGLFSYPGAKFAGRVYVIDISFPKDIAFSEPQYFFVESDCEILRLPGRDLNAHKGKFGHLMVVGGSPGKTGAVLMASLAAYRIGTGLVTIAIQDYIKDYIESKPYEVMLLFYGKGKNVDSVDAAYLLREMNSRSAAVIGPGWGKDRSAKKVFYNIIEYLKKPLLIDADGINILAEEIDVLKNAHAPIVLTPHPGEMARLLKTDTKDVQDNRVALAIDFAKENNVYLVLKGARTLITTPEGKLYISPFENPAMATGGMGDILSGIIGGFLAQGFPPEKAAVMGVYFHGLAAERSTRGPGLIATDLLGALPGIISEFTKI